MINFYDIQEKLVNSMINYLRIFFLEKKKKYERDYDRKSHCMTLLNRRYTLSGSFLCNTILNSFPISENAIFSWVSKKKHRDKNFAKGYQVD